MTEIPLFSPLPRPRSNRALSPCFESLRATSFTWTLLCKPAPPPPFSTELEGLMWSSACLPTSTVPSPSSSSAGVFVPSFRPAMDVNKMLLKLLAVFAMPLKVSLTIVLLLLTSFCLIIFVPAVIVAYQEAANKREFLANFLTNTSFALLTVFVSFFLGTFVVLKKNRSEQRRLLPLLNFPTPGN
ncbi:hypothetical protein QR680_016671 [Steinernema hermaphroditum]|uniref:Uncharacterized protein n=1 Tax=Steinernema hermaphroditum TaxID=289476 RepID=A0AA39HD16_9BILA|nr:hypothetical protein QR680_016671 [Steinernema hermaphroditum]